MSVFTWSKWETGEFVEISEDFPSNYSHNPKCPLCGRITRESSGTIDQDEQGNDIEAYWYDCDNCGIQTQRWIMD